ncbi:VOC family protein [Flavobacterium silvaticum]|nr:VOC family protein [Flavobacterium silvaticum]
MKFSAPIPMLYTNELDESIDFYTNQLGFTCGERNNEWGWAALYKDDCEFMFAKPNEHIPFDKPFFTGSFYIKVPDPDGLFRQLKDAVNVCYEPETFEWGMREFAIYDNNGYLLQFGCEV